MDELAGRSLLSRRNLLVGGSVGAGALWIAPAMTAISMTNAHAASGPAHSVKGPKKPGGSKNNNGSNGDNNPGRRLGNDD